MKIGSLFSGIGGLDFDKPGGGFGFEANEPCGVLGGGGGGCLGGIHPSHPQKSKGTSKIINF